MTKLALGAAMALTILTGQVQAGEPRAGFVDGNELYADCTGPPDSFQRGVRLGYIQGVADHIDEVRWGRDEPQCPTAVVLKQVEGVVVNYLRDHPVDRSNPATELATIAITQTWNCK
jgi:hypothetical protein